MKCTEEEKIMLLINELSENERLILLTLFLNGLSNVNPEKFDGIYKRTVGLEAGD